MAFRRTMGVCETRFRQRRRRRSPFVSRTNYAATVLTIIQSPMSIISGSSDHVLYAHAGHGMDGRSKFAEFDGTTAKVRRTFIDVQRHSVATVRQSCTRPRDKVRLVGPSVAHSATYFEQKRTFSYGLYQVGCFPAKIKLYVVLGFQFVLRFFRTYTWLVLVQISVSPLVTNEYTEFYSWHFFFLLF